jgi:2-methylaconitate cis-trans-isomerase PrpF
MRCQSELSRPRTSRCPAGLRLLPRFAFPKLTRTSLLVSAMGAGNLLEIDGIGGGHPLTSKVAIVSPSRVPGADVDYLFAQVRVEQRLVDTSPNCGNMIAGVGPFAIEAGMVSAQDGETRVRIFNVSTGYSIMQATWCRHVSREGRLKTPPEAT